MSARREYSRGSDAHSPLTILLLALLAACGAGSASLTWELETEAQGAPTEVRDAAIAIAEAAGLSARPVAPTGEASGSDVPLVVELADKKGGPVWLELERLGPTRTRVHLTDRGLGGSRDRVSTAIEQGGLFDTATSDR
ncbi:MAG: hypothetical protein AAFZ65_20700 [Planctomycetota bacterium]